MNRLHRLILWTFTNGKGLADELNLAVALGQGVSSNFFAQVEYYSLQNPLNVLTKTDQRYRDHNQVSLAALIQIEENQKGWRQKADLWIDTELLVQVQDRLPNVLWVYFPIHDITVTVPVFK